MCQANLFTIARNNYNTIVFRILLLWSNDFFNAECSNFTFTSFLVQIWRAVWQSCNLKHPVQGVTRGGEGGGPDPSEFGRSVNPIQTRGQIIPLTLLPAPPPPIQKAIYTSAVTECTVEVEISEFRTYLFSQVSCQQMNQIWVKESNVKGEYVRVWPCQG